MDLWNLPTPTATPTRLRHNGQINAVAFTPDGTRLVAGGQNAGAMWRLANHTRIDDGVLDGPHLTSITMLESGIALTGDGLTMRSRSWTLTSDCLGAI